jgi:peptide/nickel transport system substrate-binding protein
MNFNISTLVVAGCLLALTSCKHEGSGADKKISDKNGGTFSMAENSEVGTLFPHTITAQVEGLITSQIHESLVRLNPKTLEVIPGLAQSWETSADGKTITFHLVKEAFFQDDKCYKDGKGPEITSKDIKYTFELLSTKSELNYQFETILKDRLAGANDFYSKKTGAVSGIKIIDDYTFSLELVNPSLSFLKLLANPSASILNETAVKAYGKDLKIGAGPFRYDASSTKEKFVLTRNPNYYAADSAGYSLPYLDTVVINILPIEEGLALFESQKLDLINTLPSMRVKEVVENNINEFAGNPPRYILQREPEMISQFYVFNTKTAPFNNVKVRQAFNYAVNRDKLVDNVLQGQAIGSAIYGITPNTFMGYNIKNIRGYSLDIEKAKKLLAEAGYPDGKGFPETNVLVNSGNSRNSSVAVELQKQLKENLNININFESLPNVQKYDLQMHGKSAVFRDAWVADYSSPESFLSLFVGETVPADNNAVSFPNTSRYQNPVFDTYFKKGRNFNIKDSSYANFMRAEQILIDDAVIIPLWYEGSFRLLTNKTKNLNLNGMRYYDLTKVYKVK